MGLIYLEKQMREFRRGQVDGGKICVSDDRVSLSEGKSVAGQDESQGAWK